VLRRFGRESYSDPREVYERALDRGMDLVTLTDHDSIDGALAIANLPGTFVSEEVTVVLPGERELHLGVFDIDEAQHDRLGTLRRDPDALFAYLAERRIPACINHPFSALTGRRETGDLALAFREVPLVEALNGSMPSGHNALALRAGREAGLAGVGGSDAHSLRFVARAYTVVPGARSKEEFLEGLRLGLTVPRGRAGSYARLTSEVGRIFAAGYRDAAAPGLGDAAAGWRLLALLALTPLLGLIPVVTAAVYLHERRFGPRQFRRLQLAQGRLDEPFVPRPLAPPRPLWGRP
jgi:predicted metal-dependent phosphoesterase TrpH